MSIPSATLMVNLEPGRSNAGLLRVARLLAANLGAEVIGVAARQPAQFDISGISYVPPDVFDDEQAESDAELNGAEAEFRGVFTGADVEWRSSMSNALPADYIVEQARQADLLMTGMTPGKADPTRASASDLVMHSGRPVLVVPRAPLTPCLDHVLVAWKDTREARRAALDALPLLKHATHVTVVEMAADEDTAAAQQHVADVSRWLARHGVSAEVIAAASSDDDAAQLESLARKLGVNLIVAGAYGHSRLREWAFGGVTRSLLHRGEYCSLLSH